MPETYPKAFTIFGQSANLESVYELIKQTYQKNPDQMPVFMTSSSFVDRDEILKRLKKEFPKVDWKNQFIHAYIGSSDDATTYIRDPFHSRVNSKGEVEVFETRAGYDVTDEMRSVFAKCGIGVESQEASSKNDEIFDQTTLGGNFLNILPGVNVSTELTELHQQAGWNEKNTIEVDYVTNVRHIDEILQPVKMTYDEKGCPKVTALIANPDKALELIRQQAVQDPKSQAFDFTFDSEKYSSADYSQEYDEFKKSRNIISETRNVLHLMIQDGIGNPNSLNGFHQICNAYQTLPKVDSLDYRPEDYTEVTFVFGEKRGRVIVLNDPDRKPDEVITLSKGYTEEQYRAAYEKCSAKPSCRVSKTANPPVPAKPCVGLSASDLYQVMKYTDYNKAESAALSKLTTELKTNVEKKVAQQYPQCKNVMDWVDTPAILNDGSWALPNSTNSLPVTPGSIGMTDPYIKTFKNYLKDQMKKRDVEVTWFDTLGLNNFKKESKTGNLHCSTNSIPICDPK